MPMLTLCQESRSDTLHLLLLHLSGDIITLCGRRPDDESPIGEPYKGNGERQEEEEKSDGN